MCIAISDGIAADAHLRRLHQADRILAAGGDDIHAVDDDLLGGGGDRHQAGGALAVDRLGADGDRTAGAERDLRPILPACMPCFSTRAPDDVVDLAGVDPRALDRRRERQRAERRRRAWR